MLRGVRLRFFRALLALAPFVTSGLSGCSFAVDSSELDAGCGPGFKYCDGCVRVDDPAYGCDPVACTPCPVENAIPTCVGVRCDVASCLAGWGCPPDCETPVLTDEDNCGSCGNQCNPDELCIAGECVVPEG